MRSPIDRLDAVPNLIQDIGHVNVAFAPTRFGLDPTMGRLDLTGRNVSAAFQH
jgi:hypothetical protein